MGAPEIVELLGVNAIRVCLDEDLYPQAVIARAAFRLSDRASCLLARDEQNARAVWATFFSKQESIDLQLLVRDFADELLDQKLRQKLEEDFGDLRLIITAQAFAEGNLLNPDDDAADFRADPRSIASAR